MLRVPAYILAAISVGALFLYLADKALYIYLTTL